MAFGFTIVKEPYKMVVVVRNDLKMGKGKIAAQVGHAAVECALYAQKKDKKSFDAWYATGQAKIVLKVDSEEELDDLMKMARSMGITSTKITDAGRTQIAPGTVTCLGLGPAPDSELDKVTGELKML